MIGADGWAYDLAGAFAFAGLLVGACVVWLVLACCTRDARRNRARYRARRRIELERAGYRFRR